MQYFILNQKPAVLPSFTLFSGTSGTHSVASLPSFTPFPVTSGTHPVADLLSHAQFSVTSRTHSVRSILRDIRDCSCHRSSIARSFLRDIAVLPSVDLFPSTSETRLRSRSSISRSTAYFRRIKGPQQVL